jgi:hypothetical protein
VSPSEEGGTFRGAVVSESTFVPDFHQQFGAHLVEESKTTWQGRDQQGPKPPRPDDDPTSSVGSCQPFGLSRSAFGGNRRRRECPCDNPPRKILYYRLRPIHFGH